MTVRDGRRADLPALRAVQAASLAEPWRELLELAPEGPPILLVTDDAPGDTAPAESSGASAVPTEPVGYALAVTDGDEAVGYLVELAVAPGYRGEGRGSALLSALVGRLRDRGVERLRVTVRTVDADALAFYEKHGFERRDRLPDRYESGDGLLLVREIE